MRTCFPLREPPAARSVPTGSWRAHSALAAAKLTSGTASSRALCSAAVALALFTSARLATTACRTRHLCPATSARAGRTTARAQTPDSVRPPPVAASPDSWHPAHAAIFPCTARRSPPNRESPTPLPSTQSRPIACLRPTDRCIVGTLTAIRTELAHSPRRPDGLPTSGIRVGDSIPDAARKDARYVQMLPVFGWLPLWPLSRCIRPPACFANRERWTHDPTKKGTSPLTRARALFLMSGWRLRPVPFLSTFTDGTNGKDGVLLGLDEAGGAPASGSVRSLALRRERVLWF